MQINPYSPQVTAGLLLVPMFIPGWRAPVLPAGVFHGGIPQSIYQPPSGLYMVIDPVTTLSTTLAVGDSVELWHNGQPTGVIKNIKKGEENDRIEMDLPPGWLVDGQNDLFYRVTRPSGNYEDSTPILNVLYHDPAPGYPAPAGITITHPAFVGPTEAAAGVVFLFNVSFARQHDEIVLTVGVWKTTIKVTDPTKPITVTLTAADFKLIGDNPNTPVRCVVTDQLGNRNQSATTFMNIQAAGAPAPVIDPSRMALDQISFFNSYGWPYQSFNESSTTRPATGGIAPHIYRSGNPNIATVDGNGKVVAVRNGTTTITATDATGRSGSYTVQVDNVFQLLVNNSMLTADQASAWVRSVGGRGDGNLEFLPISHLANYGRDLFENRIYPDPLAYRWTQIQPAGMGFRIWEGNRLSGAWWPWGSTVQMRAITAVPS
ncbi:Ig-like domain-containing protein [Pseudomonas allokribbensis]|uniref:Ig-like domain-containing protein n=1 Tax=Pseudomonas allokribbensis TaxID=2774460 RepID=UPI0017884660|nr:Ig-like domain-containing protein [Pseudomonas allokribbensis]